LSLNPYLQVHIQDLALPISEIEVRAVPVPEPVNRVRKFPKSFSNEIAPLNMLNLTNKTHGAIPQSIYQEFALLQKACQYSTDAKMLSKGHASHAGKEQVGFCTANDMMNCIQFRIFAMRGAVSGWHMDNAGVWTWIQLEGNSNDLAEDDYAVRKLCPIFPMHLPYAYLDFINPLAAINKRVS
jgi:hypothetical protein